MDTPDNAHTDCFWQANVDVAAAKLAAILVEVGADVLTVYDSYGGYGHPDHIQVHRVGHMAAELAGIPRVFEVSMNRDRMRAMQEMRPGVEDGPGDEDERFDINKIGFAESEITTAVDVSEFLSQKKAAMAAHKSQIADDSWFLTLPPDVFAMAFATEWFRQTKPEFRGDPISDRGSWILADPGV